MLEQTDGDLTQEELKRLQKEVPGAQSYKDSIKHYQNLVDSLYDNPKSHSQKWYNLHGEKRKFKDLMLECSFNERDYMFFYGLGSLDTHGNSSAVNLNLSKDISFDRLFIGLFKLGRFWVSIQ